MKFILCFIAICFITGCSLAPGDNMEVRSIKKSECDGYAYVMEVGAFPFNVGVLTNTPYTPGDILKFEKVK